MMSNVVDFSDRLKLKTDETGERRQILDKDFVDLALANPNLVAAASEAFDKKERAINAAIYNAEVARARWLCTRNS